MKPLLAGLILLIALTACAEPPQDVPKATITGPGSTPPSQDEQTGTLPIDVEASAFEFEGYGPGKAHKGTFTQMEGSLRIENGTISGAQGTIKPESVDTGIAGLNRHLKSADFFDVDRCPEITFTGTIQDGMMIGVLDFHCIEHEISFPVTRTEDSISADFLLDITPFELRYLGINDNVRITFNART